MVMSYPQFIIKGIDREGLEVRVTEKQFTSRYRAEIDSLDFYSDHRFKLVWVERSPDINQAA
tara:strand:+ start:9476 stop:9661 length:186 start_codon:yes stop_codon:yes gene_type:complete